MLTLKNVYELLVIKVAGEEDVDDSEQFYYSFWGKNHKRTFSIGKLAYFMELNI